MKSPSLIIAAACSFAASVSGRIVGLHGENTGAPLRGDAPPLCDVPVSKGKVSTAKCEQILSKLHQCKQMLLRYIPRQHNLNDYFASFLSFNGPLGL